MSEEASTEEKTEEASAKRKTQFREDGKVAKSTDLAAAIMLLAGSGALHAAVSIGGSEIGRTLRGVWMNLNEAERFVSQPASVIGSILAPVLGAMLPTFAILTLAAFAAHFAQSGPVWAPKALEFKPEKLLPHSGLKRMFFSPETVVNLLKTIGKVAFVGLIASGALYLEAEQLLSLNRRGPKSFADYLQGVTFSSMFAAALGMLVLGGLDFAWQTHRTNKQMRMTKDEAKREHKESEGDPLMKGRRMQKHRELLSMNRLIDSVPTADVIINNPTHISVALRYRASDGAPVVVAKGADHMALRIRELASEHKVPMVTDIPLARALHKAVPVGQHIPEDFFKAVAEVLVFVWKQHGRRE